MGKNMKKYLFLICIIVCLITGCSSAETTNPEAINQTTNAPVITATLAPTATATPFPTATPVPTELPTPSPEPTATPTPSPTPLPSIYDNLTETSDPGLYSYNLEQKDCVTMASYKVDDRLLLTVLEDYYHTPDIISINPVTGDSKKLTTDFTSYCYNIQTFSNDSFAVVNLENSHVDVYDKELSPLTQADVPFSLRYAGSSYSYSGKYIYNIDYDKEEVVQYDLYTGELRLIIGKDLPVSYDQVYISALSEDDSYILLGTYQEDLDFNSIYINLENGEYTCYSVTPAALNFSPDRTKCLKTVSVDGYYTTEYYCFEEALPAIIRPEDYDSYFTPENLISTVEFENSSEYWGGKYDWINDRYITTHFIFSTTSLIAYNCYDLNTGKPVSNCVASIETLSSQMEFELYPELGMISINGIKDDEAAVYFWNYMEDDISSAFYTRLDIIPEYIDNHRKELEEKYNINFYLGGEIALTDFDYRVTPSKDFRTMDRVLDIVDKALGNYPADFFEQIKTGSTKTLGIYLCAGFEKTNDSQIDTAMALASEMGYERYLVLDINYESEIERTMYHEISHWIDHTISNLATKNPELKGFEDEWLALNPEDFTYDFDYNGPKSNKKYLFTLDTRVENKCYFIDDYSMTFPTEDRARIFEYMMVYDGCDYYSSQAMREKVRFYFDYIRKAFNTDGWPEETSWERNLRLLEEYYTGNTELSIEEIYPPETYFDVPEDAVFDPYGFNLWEHDYYYDPYAVG